MRQYFLINIGLKDKKLQESVVTHQTTSTFAVFFSKQRCFLMGRPALYLLLQHHYTIEKLKCILIIISSFPPVKSTKNSVFENKIILLHA